MTTKSEADRALEQEIGDGVRALRLRQNLDQRTVAARANISLGALKNLESGSGSTLTTLARVLHVLGRLDALTSIDPRGSAPLSPRYGLGVEARKRASRPRSASGSPSPAARSGS